MSQCARTDNDRPAIHGRDRIEFVNVIQLRKSRDFNAWTWSWN